MSRMTRSTDAGAAALGSSSTRSPIPIDHEAGQVVDRDAGEPRDVGARHLGELLASLEREQAPVGADRPQQPERERAGSDARLDDRRAGEDVGQGEDLRGILRVDDGRAARHRHHEVGEQRAQREVGVAVGGLHDAAVGCADQHVVGQDAAVRVELLARFQRDRVDAPLGTGQLDAVTGDERAGGRAGRAHRAAPAWLLSTAARSAGDRPSRLSQRVYAGLAGSGTCMGTAIVAMPAATAAATPYSESSIATLLRRIDPEQLGGAQVALGVGLAR